MLTVVVGGQWGSEAKGAVCAELHRVRAYDAAVRVGGPQAGHTVVSEEGRRYALRQLPVAAVADRGCELYIAAGSEVDPTVLAAEIALLEADGYAIKPRLHVDAEATVLMQHHADRERAAFGDGHSTKKGVGAARADRALRQAVRMEDLDLEMAGLGVYVADTQRPLAAMAADPDTRLMLEGTQGYGLGTHAGYYPYCTSGDCRATDFMAMAGLRPIEPDDVWVVLRTYPIRIAGDSGPLHGETTWEAIGVPPEYTTVTKKVRRVGTWDAKLARRAVEANMLQYGRTRVALTFVDYVYPNCAGVRHGPTSPLTLDDTSALGRYVRRIEEQVGAPVDMLGTGPDTQMWVAQDDRQSDHARWTGRERYKEEEEEEEEAAA